MSDIEDDSANYASSVVQGTEDVERDEHRNSKEKVVRRDFEDEEEEDDEEDEEEDDEDEDGDPTRKGKKRTKV
jgi:hypothetical protein